MGASAIYRQLTGERRAEHTQNAAKLPISRFSGTSRQPLRGPSLRVRNDMADLSKKSMLRACRRSFYRQPGSKPSNRTRRPAMGFSSTCPAPRTFHRWRRMEERTDFSSATRSHEQIGRTRAYVITKWRQSKIQQVKETKVPPPRTHGKVGDQVGGQCSAVR
jgi:hypothetical protein